MRLALVITERCNAACAHCSDSCGPSKTTALSAGLIKEMMTQAAALSDDGPPEFGITGGEPFLDFDKLVEIVAHARRVGGTVTCVTNAYWAASNDKARSKLLALKESGLHALGVSTSRFHQQFIARDRVQRALDAARALGIGTVLKCAITKSDECSGDGLASWARSSGADTVEVFPVLPYLREGVRWPEAEFIRQRGLPKGTCPSPQLTIRENGTAYTCCHPGGFSDFLSLGDVRTTSLKELQDSFYLNGRQRVLRERGPIHFARAIRKKGGGHLLRHSYASVCDLCAHIATQPQLAALAKDAAKAYEIKELRAIFRGLIRGRRG